MFTKKFSIILEKNNHCKNHQQNNELTDILLQNPYVTSNNKTIEEKHNT